MSPTETLHDAAEATREYGKGVDRATAIRRLFAFWMAFTIVVSLVPPGVLYLGGPDLSPVGVASAEPYNLSDASFKGDYSHSVQGITFGPNGENIYFLDSGDIKQGELSTPWDITTLTVINTFQTVESGFTSIRDIAIGKNGEKIYVTDTDSDLIREYTLSTAYNLSTASLTTTLDISNRTDWAMGVDISENGNYLFVLEGVSYDLIKYDLSTAFDTTTASHSNTVTLNSPNGNNLNGLSISNNGKFFYIADTGNANIHRYDSSVSYSLSDIGLSPSQSAALGASDRTSGVFVDKSGSYVYASDDSSNAEIQWYKMVDATVSGTITYASNGTAVEGASITVNASSASDTTDASGAYSLALDNGTYEITATKGDFANSITVTVSGSDLTGQDIVLSSETLTLDVPTHMFPNETAAYEVTLEGSDVTDAANVTSSDPTNLTVNQTSNELEATSDTSFAGEITITAEHDGLSASRNVTVANLSAENVGLMQNAADMTAAIWGDVQGPDGTRPGGTQLTMRVLFVALLIGAAIATHASGFAGIGGITLIVVMGWFMGWVSDGMALVTVFTGLFTGLNLAANIDYSVRK